jgi:GntR family transcriptional regulator
MRTMEKELMERSPENIELDSNDKLDLASAVPYYLQLRQHMEQQIKSGVWKPGSKLPSEQMLCEHFKVSRTVVRQALNSLTSSGMATTLKGKGSFVTQPKMAWKLMQSLSGFYEDAIARGQKVNTHVLELDTVPANEEIAQILHISEGDPVIKLHRLRFLDGEPVVVVTTYIPHSLCPELLLEDFTDQSLYRVLLEKFNLVVADGIRTIESINASQPLAKLLEINNGAAVSVLKSVGYLSNGVPLEYFISWHRGDRSRFQVRLTSSEL